MESIQEQQKNQTIANPLSLSNDLEKSKVDNNLISEKMNKCELVILGKSYELSLENNETVSELVKLFPMAI